MTTLGTAFLGFLPTTGIIDQIFHQTWISISVLGEPNGGYKVTLIGLIIIALIAFAVNVVIERLTGRKTGGLARAVGFTLVGAFLVSAFVSLPFEIIVEGV